MNGTIITKKHKIVNTNHINRHYYLNLFSTSAEKTYNGTHIYQFRWNIRNLKLGSNAVIGLVQMIHDASGVGGHTTTPYSFRLLEAYQDGFDSYNNSSAMIYAGIGLKTPQITTYHKLTTDHLNTITIIATGDNTSADKISSGIDGAIFFGIVLEVIDYYDTEQ
jgi:hypothetical protein